MNRSILVLSVMVAGLSGPEIGTADKVISTHPVQENERAALFPSPVTIELGKSVAEAACAKCHGMDGLSNEDGKPHLASQRTVYLYRALQAYQNGEIGGESMQHRGSFLNDEAMLAVSAYYASMTPVRFSDLPRTDDSPEPFDDRPFLGIEKSLKKCHRCHGETGNSTASGMPNLTAQDPEYFVTSMLAYVDGTRNHKMMKKLVDRLEEQTIREMGVFYAVQEPLRTETVGEGDAATGSQLAEDCANCHGSDGNATGSDMPSLAGQDARYFVKAMRAYKEGKRQHEKMFTAVEWLSETDITDLAAYYATQEPARRNVRTPFTTTEWLERCDRCHGMNGNSTDPRFPMLAGQDERYLRNAMRAYTAGTRSRSIMHAMSAPLSETDINRIVSHYASQEPKSVIYLQLPCEDPDSE